MKAKKLSRRINFGPLDKFVEATNTNLEEAEFYCHGCEKRHKMSEFRYEYRDNQTRKNVPFLRCRKCRSVICLDPFGGLHMAPEDCNFILNMWALGLTTTKIKNALAAKGGSEPVTRASIFRVVRRFARRFYAYAVHSLKPRIVGNTWVFDDFRVDLVREFDLSVGLKEKELWCAILVDAETGLWVGFGVSPHRGEASMKAASMARSFTGVDPATHNTMKFDGANVHAKAIKTYFLFAHIDSKTKQENPAQSNEAEGPISAIREMGAKKRRFRNAGSVEIHIMLCWVFYNFVHYHTYDEQKDLPARRAGIPMPRKGLPDHLLLHSHLYALRAGNPFRKRRKKKSEKGEESRRSAQRTLF